MQKLIAGVALGLAASAAIGEQRDAAEPAVLPAFETLDRNGDHRLSRSEAGYDQLLSTIFAGSDADGDGYVSRAEYARALMALGAQGGERRSTVSM